MVITTAVRGTLPGLRYKAAAITHPCKVTSSLALLCLLSYCVPITELISLHVFLSLHCSLDQVPLSAVMIDLLHIFLVPCHV